MVLDGMIREIQAEPSFLPSKNIDTIYFGGGTPSLLSAQEIERILNEIHQHFPVNRSAEITLELNPEDGELKHLDALLKLGINRLSMGVQSMNPDILAFSNRNHEAQQSLIAYQHAREVGFSNISVDLMFGFPGQTLEQWKSDVEFWISQRPEHISLYSLTVEDRTALKKWVKAKEVTPLEDEKVAEMFHWTSEFLERHGWEHYEVSNFAREGFRSRHNGNYWKGVPYVGIGPAAHGYDGERRRWNPRNNVKYGKAWKEGVPAWEEEQLTEVDRFNEQLMVRLRTREGLKKSEINPLFAAELGKKWNRLDPKYRLNDSEYFRFSKAGWLVMDALLVDLFEG
jgi:oxygen-independent coproporphyrinogen-3 oxidase